MRTTVDLKPGALAELKAMAAREKLTLGRMIEQLIETARRQQMVEEIDGLPVLRPSRKVPLTSEEVYRLLDEPAV